MPLGYYTIEQWKQPKAGGSAQWVAILQLPFGWSLTAAEQALARLGKPGFYRLIQMQRVIWAEENAGKLRLRKSHASSPENLDQMRQIFDRTGGKYPLEEARAARRQQKKNRSP